MGAMMNPSYLYSGLDQRTRNLQADLDALGGGDSRTANMGLHVVIDDIRGRRQSKILWQLDNFVGLRNPQMTSDASAASMSYFSATSCQTISEVLSSDSSGDIRGNNKRGSSSKPIFLDIADWSLDGYNNCIIGYGARGSGKTLTLFGPNAHSTRFPKCLCKRILESLYTRDNITIALSCWALRRNQVIDLCEDYGKSVSPSTSNDSKNRGFAMIECGDIKTALQVLYHARAKCGGVEATDPSNDLPDSKRAHFFLRITLFMATEEKCGGEETNKKGRVSHIHIVDLVGTSPLENRKCNELNEQDKECRREISLQYAALAKVLQQMKSASDNANSEEEAIMTNPLQVSSARDSKLTMMLAPLIQGNVRTNIMLFLKDHEGQYKHCKSALMSLKDICETVSACHVNYHLVEKSSLEMRHPDRVLSPKPQYYSTLQKYWHTHGTADSVPPSAALIDLLQSSQAQYPKPNSVTTSQKAISDSIDEHQSPKEEAPSSSQNGPLMNDYFELMAEKVVDGMDKEAPGGEPTLISLAAEPMDQYSEYVSYDNEDGGTKNDDFMAQRGVQEGGEWDESSFHEGAMLDNHLTPSDVDLHLQDQVHGNTPGLLEALQMEKKSRILAEGKLLDLKDDLLEKMTAREVELDEAKVEIIRLKTKLRQVSADRNIQEIYDTFEEDVKRLNNENSALRRRNLAMEERLSSLELENSSNHSSSKNNIEGSRASQSIELSSSDKWVDGNGEFSGVSVSNLRSKLRTVSRENVALKSQIEEFKKKERLSLISDRAAMETSNRIKSLNTEYRKVMKQFEAERDMTHRLQCEIMELKQHRSRLEENESFLKSERMRLIQSVRSLQNQVIEVVQDKKNVEKLNKFIEKHSPSSPKKVYRPGSSHRRDFLDFSEPPKTVPRRNNLILNEGDGDKKFNNRKDQRSSSPTPAPIPTPASEISRHAHVVSQTTSGNPRAFSAYKSLLASNRSNIPQAMRQAPIWQ